MAHSGHPSSSQKTWWRSLVRAQQNPMPPGVLNRNRTREIIDNGRLVKRLFWVGASGFFARSYTFFSGNVIKLALHYVYPHNGRLNSNPGMVLDQIGHVAAIVSMIIVGHLADLFGRKRLYGYELLLLVVATLGIVQASEGFRSREPKLPDGTVPRTMDIYAWLAFWRFCLGLAIGAEQPLVAIITAEWVRTKSRGRMMAAVFSVQPIARLVAYGVALVALQQVSNANGMSLDTTPNSGGEGGDDNEAGKRVADQVWRWATGMGIIPALVAIVFRFTIPETPLYYADILLDAVKGAKETAWLYGTGTLVNHATPLPLQNIDGSPQTALPLGQETSGDDDSRILETPRFRHRDWYAGAVRCLRTTSAGRNLLLMSSLWMLSDMSWYFLSLDSLAPTSTLQPNDPATNPFELYREMKESALHFIVVVSIGSLLGSATLLVVINRVHRRVLLMATCSTLAVLFAIAGAVVLGRGEEALGNGPPSNTAIDVLSGMMHFLCVHAGPACSSPHHGGRAVPHRVPGHVLLAGMRDRAARGHHCATRRRRDVGAERRHGHPSPGGHGVDGDGCGDFVFRAGGAAHVHCRDR
ncbi:major facilitator superfamily domain-containing protein [Podospora conica]|nr:major facilitator superfamily domain-containing protein [Schizothecium conicum]